MSAVKFINSNYLKGPKGDKGDKGDPGTSILSSSGRITYNPATKAIGFNATGLATEDYVNNSIATLVDGAPALLNTIRELASAIDNNPNFITDVTAQIDSKLSLTGGTLTGPLTLNGAPTTGLQAATKQYVDTVASGITISNTDGLSEGSTNLYFTNDRARAAIGVSGAGSYDSSTGIINITGGVTSVNTKTGAVVLDTTDVAEGTNLYYTTARSNADFDTRLITKTTSDLVEGTNLYHTTNRARSAISVTGAATYDSNTGVINVTGGVTSVNTKTDAVVLDTSDIAEGTNLYFTTSRARNAISVTGDLNYNSVTGVISFTAAVGFSGDYNDLINKPTIPDSILDLGINDGINGQYLTTDGSGNFTFVSSAWDGVTFDGGEFDGTTVPGELAVDGGFLESYYVPANASDWSGTPPNTVQAALDRLAAVVKTLNSGVGA